MRNANPTSSAAHILRTPHSALRTSPGFTLIELLVVISIIGVLAGFTIPVLSAVKSAQYKKVARAELEFIQTALENYKAKYGAYPPGNSANPLLPQLYYELAGTSQTTISGNNCFQTLDGSTYIKVTDVPLAYGVGGFVNCTKGNGEDDIKAKNFLSGIRQQNIYSPVTNNSQPPYNNNITTTVLKTSVGGPDDTYQPLTASGLNPFRYVYPGVNNPNSYDLWVQLVIKGKTNLVCNWSRQVIINSALP
jgi:prepilin-type N-terminal cleavage/methylation domain-containing protein